MGTGWNLFDTVFREMEDLDWPAWKNVRKMIRDGTLVPGYDLQTAMIIEWLRETDRRENLRQCLYYGM